MILNPNSIQSLSGLGRSLLAQEEYNEALLAIEKAISKRANSVGLWMQKSLIYWEIQNYEMALISVEAAIQNKYDFKKRIKSATESIENKHKEYEDSIAKISSTDRFIKIVKMIQIRNELDEKYKLEASLDTFEDSDFGNFSLEELYLMKCEILLKMDRKNEALEDLCKVSELNPKNSKSWFVQGRLCGELGLFDESVYKYEMILEFEPKNKLALYGKSISLYKSQKIKEAIESFEFLVSIYQDDEELWVEYGLIALDFGKKNNENSIICRAAYAFQKASEFDQGNVKLWLNAAVSCKKIGSAYGTEFCLKRAAEIDIEFVKIKVKNDIIFQPLKDLESALHQPIENLKSRKAIGKDIFKRVFRLLF